MVDAYFARKYGQPALLISRHIAPEFTRRDVAVNLDARRRGAALDLLDRYRIALTSSAQTAIFNSIFIPVCHCDKFQSETYAMRAHFIASRKIFVLYLFRNRNLLFFYIYACLCCNLCIIQNTVGTWERIIVTYAKRSKLVLSHYKF